MGMLDTHLLSYRKLYKDRIDIQKAVRSTENQADRNSLLRLCSQIRKQMKFVESIIKIVLELTWKNAVLSIKFIYDPDQVGIPDVEKKEKQINEPGKEYCLRRKYSGYKAGNVFFKYEDMGNKFMGAEDVLTIIPLHLISALHPVENPEN